MKLPIYQIDAFADSAFTGNPAAVVPLQEWIQDALMRRPSQQRTTSQKQPSLSPQLRSFISADLPPK